MASLLHSFALRVIQPDVVGVTCSGSQARGEAGAHSDVDLQIYVRGLPASPYDRYTMRNWDGHLVSLKTLTVEAQSMELSEPSAAIWAVPGLRQALILHDPQGEVRALKQVAIDFQWEPLQPRADEYAAEELMACSEEAHKILAGLQAADESKVLYGVWGLMKGLTAAVATQRAVMIETENRYFDLVQESVGASSEWTRHFRVALGADAAGLASIRPFVSRGRAALRLYRLTADLFAAIIPGKHRLVIETTLQLLAEAGF